jgi:hypothetical protein
MSAFSARRNQIGPALRPRRALAFVGLLAAIALVALSPAPAQSDSVKGSLDVLSVNDSGTGLAGAVAGRPFDIVIAARDPLGAPLAVSTDTRVRVDVVTGSGTLGGTQQGTIARRTTQGTISGATYSTFGNKVQLRVSVLSGVALSPATVMVNVASTAVRAVATPGSALSVTDPGCAAPTSTSPVCGYLQLPKGGNGVVLMSVGSCDTILTCRTVSGTAARLVTADVSLKDANGDPLYTQGSPATFILACDKVLCGNGGVTQFPVAIDLTNTGAFNVLDPCPAKGVLGTGQTACLDTVQSKRDIAGDLISYVLFTHDIRGSYP